MKNKNLLTIKECSSVRRLKWDSFLVTKVPGYIKTLVMPRRLECMFVAPTETSFPSFRCWNMDENDYMWIIKGPIILTVLVSKLFQFWIFKTITCTIVNVSYKMI